METSNPYRTLNKLVDAENITNEEVSTLVLPVEININQSMVTSELESQNISVETYAPNPEVMFTQTTDAYNRS